MIVQTPELGTMDGKEAARFAGFAPIARGSGMWEDTLRIGGGRRGLRKALYVLALVALHEDRQLAQTIRTLGSAVQPVKFVSTAVVHTLPIPANAPIRDERKWAETTR